MNQQTVVKDVTLGVIVLTFYTTIQLVVHVGYVWSKWSVYMTYVIVTSSFEVNTEKRRSMGNLHDSIQGT